MSKLLSISLSGVNSRKSRKENSKRVAARRSWATFGQISAVIGLSLILAMCAGQVKGQAVNATLLGTVTDSSGAAVGDVKVTIKETNTGISRASQTNESGNYVFPDLPPGTYTVIAELSGFKRASRAGVDVIVNTTERVDLVLQPGNVNETVTVEAETPILQTERADTGRKLETVLTQNIPLGTNRNFQNLLNLVPGTTRATFQHSQFFNASSSLQTEVNGQLRQGNNYQIEGIDDNERTGLLQILIPPLEAIQTVDVSTSNFDAELGRASGAVTNVILKSGSNEFHGAAYEFARNSYLNARNFFDPSVGHLAYNYFGGNLGGPIIKNKLFFFADYLKVFDHEANTNRVTMPTTAFRAGDLSSSTTTIYNPFSGNPDGTGRQPMVATSTPGLGTVPGPNNTTVDAFNSACTNAAGCPNIVPTALIDPISAKLMALLPPPNLPGTSNNYFALLAFHKDTDFVDGKVDANLTSKDRLSGRFSYQRPSVFQAPIFGLAGGPAQGNFEGHGLQNTYSTGLNYNRFFSNTLVAEFRVGAGWYHNEAHNTDFGTNTSQTLGIPGVNLDKTITSGIVGITINGGFSNPLIGFSASLPWIRSETNIDFANTWTKIIGNHTLKFGADLRRIRDALLQEQTFSPRGLYTFNDGQTALNTGTGASKTSFTNNFASFLMDVPGQAGRDLATFFPNYRAWQFFTFAQDKWVVTPRFSADLGVRWEFYPPATPVAKGGFSNYNPANNTLEVSGYGNIPDDLGIAAHYKYFAPRIGLAYRLKESTVLRAGFGISYTPFPDNSYAYNFPVRANNAFNPAVASFGPAVLPNGQSATFENGFPALIQPVVPSSGVITNPTLASNYFVVNQNFKNPYVESWNLAIQRSLPWRFVIDVAYVGNHCVDCVVNYNLNAATVLGAGNAGRPEFGPFARTASTNLLFAGYSSSYHALQVKFDRKFSGGLSTTTAYTFGKGMGFQTGDDGGLSFYINQRRAYARNDFDRTQTFVQSVVYELPLGKGHHLLSSGPGAAILGGWRVSSFLTIMSGLPLYFTASGTALATPDNTQTPDLVAPVQILHGVGPNSAWFSTASFAPAAAKTFGNVGRNYLSGPNFFNLDAAVSKSTRLAERMGFELRLEAFGTTNTPQFFFASNGGSAAGTTLGSNSFGHVTSASGGRVLQLGAKLTF
ncbi:MAG TPA: carboxypeptidase regulatory-like domain-containing protein [Candidatus Acidoferrum sp.]|nr:carboxypeptidase regulatory-like domain-containing protein [Candidatus Acidoferrum sp.]